MNASASERIVVGISRSVVDIAACGVASAVVCGKLVVA